ncbi:MAG: EF-hand domain-containing protein [Pirellulales bacterium]
MEDMFRRFDANGNGTLEPAEVPERVKPFIERAVRDAGLDPAKPIPLDRLSEAMRTRVNNRMGGGPGGQRGGEDVKKPDGQQDKKPVETPPLKVAGFGGPAAATAARGFGAAKPATAAPGTKPGEAKPQSAAAPSAPAETAPAASPQADEKLKRYAESLLKQYDTNRSGVLEKDEWSKMSGDLVATADKSGDGIITKEELVQRLAAYGQASPSSRRDGGGSASPSTSGASASGSASFAGRKSYRARTPLERLPEGLPEWFTRSDKNRDGQVVMAEYANIWTEPKAAEFAGYDKNGDGVITPKECLSAEKK